MISFISVLNEERTCMTFMLKYDIIMEKYDKIHDKIWQNTTKFMLKYYIKNYFRQFKKILIFCSQWNKAHTDFVGNA